MREIRGKKVVKTTNVIEINGKMYDAHTGKPVDKNGKAEKTSSVKNESVKKVVSSKNRRSLDGLSRPGSNNKVDAKHAPEPSKQVTSKPVHSKIHKPAPHLKHKAEKSQTLNRKSVKAPLIGTAENFLPRTVEMKQDINDRLERAMKVSKSAVVSRFPSNKNGSSNNTVNKQEGGATIIHEKIIQPPTTTHNKIAKKPKKTARKLKKHVSVLAYVLSGAAVLIAIAYLIYLNVPAVSIKIAGSRAGFGASLPGYTPRGYKVDGPVKTNSQLVTIDYKSNTDNRNFSVTQQPTNWDSKALKENYVADQTDLEPITQQYNGLTIYLFNGKAAWVNAERVYTIETNGSQLGVDQILKLASSM